MTPAGRVGPPDPARYDALDRALAEGRRIRRDSDTSAAARSRWFAHLLPWMKDVSPAEAWGGTEPRLDSLIRRSGVLTAEDWRRLDFACRAVVLRDVLWQVRWSPYLGGLHVAPGVSRVLALCDRGADGASVSVAELREAAAAAWAVSLVVTGSTAPTGGAAAAAQAADDVWPVASAAVAAVLMASSGGVGEKERTTNTIIAGILDALEAAIVAREAA